MSKIKQLGFISSYSIPLLILLGYYLPQSPITILAAPFTYILVPLFDIIVGKDINNVLKEDFDELLKEKYFDILVYSHVYIQYFLILWTCYVLSVDSLSTFQIVGLFVCQGIYSGTIINVAHELGHRNSKMAQFYSKMALISVCYYHFFVEHNRGHHVHVATPKDPATSKWNQNLYAFWIQTIFGGLKSAWNIEKVQNLKKGKTSWYYNQVLWGGMAALILFSVITFSYSSFFNVNISLITAFLIVQSVFAILLLETVNYVEHYGIERRLLSTGKYEKINPLHSWNANHFYSNLLLFNLQRHSDHHAYASRPYQVLRHFDESPQLPFGYPLMIIMALFPPLWFKIMNKKLEVWKFKAFDAEHIRLVINQFA